MKNVSDSKAPIKVTKEENDHIKELYKDKLRSLRQKGLSIAEMKIEMDKISDEDLLLEARSIINKKPLYDFSSIDINTTKPSKIVTNKSVVNNKSVTFTHTFY